LAEWLVVANARNDYNGGGYFNPVWQGDDTVKKTILACIIGVGLGAAGTACYFQLPEALEPPTPPPVAKKISVACTPPTINALGIVKPEELVEVGAQVNGMIQSFGPDSADPSKPVDHGSIVHKGDVLARIDPSVYQAQVEYAEASLARAQASLQQAEATRDQAKIEWRRAQSLCMPSMFDSLEVKVLYPT